MTTHKAKEEINWLLNLATYIVKGDTKTADQLKHDLECSHEALVQACVEVERLRDLIRHMDLHSAYSHCGYKQMTQEEKDLFRRVTDPNHVPDFGQHKA